MNWMRRTEQPVDRASALASIVLPTPGTSSISTCPSASRTVSARRTASDFPSMTDSTASPTRCATRTSSSRVRLLPCPVSRTTCPSPSAAHPERRADGSPPARGARLTVLTDSTSCRGIRAMRALWFRRRHARLRSIAPAEPPPACRVRPAPVGPAALGVGLAPAWRGRNGPPPAPFRYPPAGLPGAGARGAGRGSEWGACGEQSALTVGDCGVQWSAVGCTGARVGPWARCGEWR